MKAYLIDTPNKQIVEVEFNGDYKTVYPLIKVDLYTVVTLNAAGDVALVDDEGLINGNPHGWFEYEGYAQPLRGYGLVLGTDNEGDSVAPVTSIEELRSKISFPNDDELKDPEEYAHIEVFGTNSPEEFMQRLLEGRDD